MDLKCFINTSSEEPSDADDRYGEDEAVMVTGTFYRRAERRCDSLDPMFPFVVYVAIAVPPHRVNRFNAIPRTRSFVQDENAL
jgi:hypothetical protein